MNATHAFNRINARVNDATLSHNLYTLAAQFARRIGRDYCLTHGKECSGYAIRLFETKETNGRMTFNTDGTGESNGNVLYAIIRNGTVFTIMWRRDNQPATNKSLRVSHIGKVSVK